MANSRRNDDEGGEAILYIILAFILLAVIWFLFLAGLVVGFTGLWSWLAWHIQRKRSPLVPNGTFNPKTPPKPPTFKESMVGIDLVPVVLFPVTVWNIVIGISVLSYIDDKIWGVITCGFAVVLGIVSGIRLREFFKRHPAIPTHATTLNPTGVPIEPTDYEESSASYDVTSSYTSVAEGYVYTLRWPRDTSWNAELATRFIGRLLSIFEPIVFRIHATVEGVVWEVVDPLYISKPNFFEEIVRSFYPEVEIDLATFRPKFTESFHRYILQYQQVQPFPSPLLLALDIKMHDPLSSLTQAISGLQAGERICYCLASAGLAEYAYPEGEKLITLPSKGNVWASKLGAKPKPKKPRFEPRIQRIYEEKLEQRLYQAVLLVQIDSPLVERVRDLTRLVDSHIVQFERVEQNALVWVDRPLDQMMLPVTTQRIQDETSAIGIFRRWLNDPTAVSEWRPARLILDARESAALWHLPYNTFAAPLIKWAASGQAPVPPASAETQTGIYIGEGKYQGKRISVFLTPEDRVTHLNIIGKTGMGKSTLLHRLIHQDIQNGEGVAVIDPHGTLVRDLLQTSIPPEREREVVILDLANPHYPPPLNPLRGHQSYVGMGRVINVIEKLFAGTDQYARLSKYLRASVGLLQADAQPTMRDLSRVFTDKDFRETLLNKVDNALVTDVWDEYDQLSSSQQAQIREPVLSRIAPFYGNPTLYPILGHPDVLDFRQFIQEKKIILISLAISEERVPEQERNLVGALVISLLQMSGMQDHATPFYVYIDEVQRFVTTSLSVVLSEARKFGLSLTIANQFLGQLVGQTLEAVMGNVGTTVCFRCSPDDARALATHMKPQFDAEDLVNLDRYQMAVKLQRQGMTQPAFTVWSPEPLPTPNDAANREQRIRTLSTEQYTPKTLAEVEAWLRARYPRRRADTATGDSNDESNHYE